MAAGTRTPDDDFTYVGEVLRQVRPVTRRSPPMTLCWTPYDGKRLRHTVATILREMGKDHSTIAQMLGQKSEAMAKHYSRRADMSKKMAETIGDFEAEVNRRKTGNVQKA